ncbi:MAG: hypothetical protein QOK40_1277, partial [Miltoncostaeaceae bacterium]|nr:hypothetical protein [Miltoncostaeaceae bacterium]
PSLDESALGFGALWGFDSVGDRIYALDPRRLVGRGRWFRVSRQRPEAIATGAGGVWLASIGPPATRRGRTVTARRTGTLVRIDPTARRITARVRLGVPGAVLPLKVAPNALAITGAEVWVGLSGLGRVLHVSTRAMAVVGAIDLGPGRLQLAAGAKLVWALNVDRATLTRIGPGRASQSWQVPLPPGIAAYPIRLALGAGGVWVLWESDGGKSGFCRFAPASRRWTPCR